MVSVMFRGGCYDLVSINPLILTLSTSVHYERMKTMVRDLHHWVAGDRAALERKLTSRELFGFGCDALTGSFLLLILAESHPSQRHGPGAFLGFSDWAAALHYLTFPHRASSRAYTSDLDKFGLNRIIKAGSYCNKKTWYMLRSGGIELIKSMTSTVSCLCVVRLSKLVSRYLALACVAAQMSFHGLSWPSFLITTPTEVPESPVHARSPVDAEFLP